MTAFERAYAELPVDVFEETTGVVELGEWYDRSNEQTVRVSFDAPTAPYRMTPAQLEELRALARRAA